MLRPARPVLAAAATAAGLAACGSGAPAAVSSACTTSPDALVAALRAAPAPVTLTDGSRLSRCVRNADSDADLQNVGLMFHQAAERLRVRAVAGDAHAAIALGYLIGATRTGAQRTNGLLAELVRRMESVGGHLLAEDPRLQAAITRGMRAGAQRG